MPCWDAEHFQDHQKSTVNVIARSEATWQSVHTFIFSAGECGFPRKNHYVVFARNDTAVGFDTLKMPCRDAGHFLITVRGNFPPIQSAESAKHHFEPAYV